MYNQIIQISDIHIPKSVDRHDEFRAVFHNLYRALDTCITGQRRALIVVCGDVLHNKDNVAPNQMMLARQFLEQLAARAPTIVIAGNHDMNATCADRIDSLTPIVSGVRNLHYFPRTGVYVFDNVAVVVNSLCTSWYDEDSDDVVQTPVEFLRAADVDASVRAGRSLVCLYHGMIEGATAGWTPTAASATRTRTVSDFSGFDAVLLGDIHARQLLAPHVGYSGSLLQQHYGEPVDGHGFFVWTLSAGGAHAEAVDVENPHAFFKLAASDIVTHIDSTFARIAKKHTVRIQVVHDDVAVPLGATCDALRVLVERLRAAGCTVREDIVVDARVRDVLDLQCAAENMNGLEYQNALLRNHMVDHPLDVPYDVLADLNCKLHAECHSVREQPRLQHWRLGTLRFKNVFCYRTNRARADGMHEIDFSRHIGTVGILGRNHSGKSSIIDVLLYALFDRCSRGRRADVVNKGATSFFIEVSFWIGRDAYMIRKHGTKRRDGLRIEYQRGDADGARLVDTTHIKQMLCDYEDFIYTCVLLQNDFYGWVDVNNTERKKYIHRMVRLEEFERQAELAAAKKREAERAADMHAQHAARLARECSSDVRDADTHLQHIEARIAELEMQRAHATHRIGELRGDTHKYRTEHECRRALDSVVAKLAAAAPTYTTTLDKKDADMHAMYEAFVERRQRALDAVMQKRDAAHMSRRADAGADINADELRARRAKLVAQTSQCNVDDAAVAAADAAARVARERAAEHDRRTSALSAGSASLRQWNTTEYDAKCRFCRARNRADERDRLERDMLAHAEWLATHADAAEAAKAATAAADALRTQRQDALLAAREIAYIDKVLADDAPARNAQNRRWNERVDALLSKIDEEYRKIKSQTCREYDAWKAEVEERTRLRTLTAERDALVRNLEYIEQQAMNVACERDLAELRARHNSLTRKKCEYDAQQTERDIAEQRRAACERDAHMYGAYIDIFGKTGLQRHVVSESLPAIERRMNDYATQIQAPFVFSLTFDEKQNIDLAIVHRDMSDSPISIELGSGYEKLVASILLRAAMNHVHYIRPQFLFIDEGFTSLDAENVQRVSALLHVLKQEYACVYIITHQMEIKDALDGVINVSRGHIADKTNL